MMTRRCFVAARRWADMSEVTAEMIERGRKGDPDEAARRRKMTIQLRHARLNLTMGTSENPGPYEGLVRQFALSARAATPAIGLLTLLAGGAAYVGLPLTQALIWASLSGFVALRFGLAAAYLRTKPPESATWRWRTLFTLVEILSGAAWSLAAMELSPTPPSNAHSLLLAIVFLVSGMTSMIASAIPMAAGGALLPTLFLVVALFSAKADAIMWEVLSLLCGGTLIYFILLANRLQRTALAGLSYQAEKEALIAELEQAKLNSDEARRRAEGANLAKSRFLATMSHELRTPLNAILGFSEVMKAELFGPHAVATYKEYSGDIHASGQHLLMLINEILDLSRVEAGRYELNEEAISLPGVVEECRHLLGLRAKNKSLDITERLDNDLPRIWADERAVRQITLNLLSNAIKFTPAGGAIAIKVGWTALGGQYLSIRDTGPGIPEDEIPIVLSSFGRGSSAQKNAEEGTGLGLPIVRGLIELHGGEFKLISKVREGTEVIVIFPPERVMNALPQVDPEAKSEAEWAASQGRRARRWPRKKAAA